MTILGVVDLVASMPLVIHVETTITGRGRCAGCGGLGRVKDRDRVMLVDLPSFGRRTRLVWRKRRWSCPDAGCPVRVDWDQFSIESAAGSNGANVADLIPRRGW